jgi:hypothetical protein
MSSEDVRGAIRHLDRYKQLISYAGLERHRHITPTDIDGLIDYNGNAFLLLECKLEGKEIDYGQKRAIENIIGSFVESGRKACCLVFRHNSQTDEIIDAKNCIVSDVYYEGKWHYYNTHNVLYYIDNFEKHWRSMGIYL